MLLAVNAKLNTSPHKMLFDRLAFGEDAGRVGFCCTDFGNSDSGPQFSIGKVLRFSLSRDDAPSPNVA
jgi:hypothetical protein